MTQVDDLARGALTYAPPAVDQLARAMDIDRRYGDLGLGLDAASVVVLAENLRIRRLATRDVRYFAAVRVRHGGAFRFRCSRPRSGSVDAQQFR